MAYFSQERKAEITPEVKNILKKYGLKGSLRVRNHSTVVLTLASGRIDFIGNNQKIMGRTWAERPTNLGVNPYHFRNHFDGEAREALTELLAALNQGNWDNSDIQTDHFDKGWYVDVEIGRWNKGYIVTA
jgi:hypothetical protein